MSNSKTGKVLASLGCKKHGDLKELYFIKKELEYYGYCPLCIEELVEEKLMALCIVGMEDPNLQTVSLSP